ncbi:MAG: hypothetical protein ACOZQL_43160 [Myxococcota bacterium]
MTNARTKHVHLFPWRVDEFALRLRVLEALFDDDRPVSLDPERQLLDATEPFDRLRVVFEVELPENLEHLAERGARLGVLLRLRCDDTRLRRGQLLELQNAHRVQFIDTIHRGDLAGSVAVEADLVRLEACAGQLPLASRPFARLAGSRPWELRIDRKRELEGVYLDVRFCSFRDDLALPEAERQNLYRLEHGEEAPVLWVNADRTELTTVLNSNAASGRAALVRELVFDLIAPSVWSQLFLRAAITICKTGEASWPWQEAVFLQLGALLHPRKTMPELQALIGAELDDLPTLLGRVDAVMQSRHELLAHAARLAEELT